MTQKSLDINHEFAGISDALALQREIDEMRVRLAKATEQLTLERELAASVHMTRGAAISSSDTLKLIFAVEAPSEAPEEQERWEKKDKIPMSTILSAAFQKEEETDQSFSEFTKHAARDLRKATHPDTGGDVETAQAVALSLRDVDDDPTLAIAKAFLAVPSHRTKDVTALGIERYRLWVALNGAKPSFADEAEAKANAEREVEGAAWRVRVQAALKSFELIIGSPEIWNSYLQSIAQEGHVYSINLINRMQPAVLAARERLVKGDPIPADKLDTRAIDAVFERIWSVLGSKDRHSLVPYSPPYQEWLEVLLPAMALLDPGEKPGQEYTYFESPFTTVQTYRTDYSSQFLDRTMESSNDYDPYKRRRGYGKYDKMSENIQQNPYQEY